MGGGEQEEGERERGEVFEPASARILNVNCVYKSTFTSLYHQAMLKRGAPQMKELISRQQHLRAATLGSLLGGVALFASGGGPARADDSGFQVSESGLKSKIIKEGTGAIPSAGGF